MITLGVDGAPRIPKERGVQAAPRFVQFCLLLEPPNWAAPNGDATDAMSYFSVITVSLGARLPGTRPEFLDFPLNR